VRLHNKVKHQVAQGGLSRHIPHSTVGPHSNNAVTPAPFAYKLLLRGFGIPNPL
jgi:hypothetical protein